MKFGLIASVVAVIAFVLALDGNLFGGDKDKVTTKVVMQKAHGAKKGEDSLLTKVKKGTASSEERKQLASLYTALTMNEPPMGEADSWKTKTKAMAEAAAKNDVDALKKIDCQGCHKEFKASQ